MAILKKLFDTNKRELKKLDKLAEKVLAKETEYANLSEEELKAKTQYFKDYVKEQKEKGKKIQDILDAILVDAFAAAREGAYRSLAMKPYKVQVMGGIALHQGDIAEMKTGEGKTLTATMPVYLNALSGEGVHVVTVNEYLSQRDKEEMGVFYEYMNLTVGLNLNSLTPEEKRYAYQCDITYSTNNELGFDYLRDNMVRTVESRVQRPLNYAVIDEVDSVLIDEARTPLIISGEGQESTSLYQIANAFVKTLKKATEADGSDGDFTLDIKTKATHLTESGIDKAESYFSIKNLYDLKHVDLTHHINQALKANFTMHLDVDYVVEEGEILIVDPFTGRTMPGRRFSEGLHQAIEAKENVIIQKESKTMATITFQNFFRMYKKLSGMTGTAKTEEEEFRNIYNMIVTTIPTNEPIARIDAADLVYVSNEAKYKAMVLDVKERYLKGQPVLLGTVAIETSELISKLLYKAGVPHKVLNAKQNESEAEIIKLAGQKGSVTIATNMAGRGTDIKLGNGVKELGGLAVIGTERHESRRIDNQLRGRSGRQGDPGYSRFYLSLEDELMVRFGADRLKKLMDLGDETPLESKMISRSVESAQKRVEGNNFDSRKQVLQYDDVLRKQREIMYKERNEVLELDKVTDIIAEMIDVTVNKNIDYLLSSEYEDKDISNISNIVKLMNEKYHFENAIKIEELNNGNIEASDIKEWIIDKINKELLSKREALGDETMNSFEKYILLNAIDQHWTDHIDQMDQLRKGIFLRSYGQIDPLREYRNEGHIMFENMVDEIEDTVVTQLLRIRVERHEEIELKEEEKVLITNDSKEHIKRSPIKSQKREEKKSKKEERLEKIKELKDKKNKL